MKLLVVLSMFALSTAQARTFDCTIGLKETAAIKADLVVKGQIIDTRVFHQRQASTLPAGTAQWSPEIETKVYTERNENITKPILVSEGQIASASLETLRFGPVTHFLNIKDDQLTWELKGDRINTSTKLAFDAQRSAAGSTAPLTYGISYTLTLRDDPAHTFEYQGNEYPIQVGLGSSFHLSCSQDIYK